MTSEYNHPYSTPTESPGSFEDNSRGVLVEMPWSVVFGLLALCSHAISCVAIAELLQLLPADLGFDMGLVLYFYAAIRIYLLLAILVPIRLVQWVARAGIWLLCLSWIPAWLLGTVFNLVALGAPNVDKFQLSQVYGLIAVNILFATIVAAALFLSVLSASEWFRQRRSRES
jgi:hypothetical protein